VLGNRRAGFVGIAAGLVAGIVVGGVVIAYAQSSTLALNAGDTAHVTCAGPSLSVANQTATALDLSCAPNPTTTTTVPATTTGATSTTIPGSGSVSEDQIAKAFGAGTVTAAVSNSTPDVAVALVSADDVSPGQTVTVAGGGLVWKLAGRTNAQRGDAEIWWTTTAGASFSVTATPAQSGKSTQLTVITFAGASGVGAVKGAGATTGPPTIALVPQATGSWVGGVGMDWDHATLRTLGPNQTLDAQNTDSAGDTYWAQHLNANTVANTSVTISDLAPTTDRWNLEAIEVTPAAGPPPSTTTTTTASATTTTTATAPSSTTTTVPSGSAPSIDASTPAPVAVQNAVTSVVSPAFSPPPGTVLYAVFSMDSAPGSGTIVSTVANTGTPLTWHQTNVEGHTDGTKIGGFVQVFWAANTAAQSNIAVTANYNVATKNVTPPVGDFQVLVVDNARTDQSAAASQAAWNIATTSAPTATVTTTAANSLVLAVFDNWDTSATPTVPTDQSLTSIVLNPTDRDTYWLQAQTAPTVVPGPVTMNATSPSNIHWHEIAWEILAA